MKKLETKDVLLSIEDGILFCIGKPELQIDMDIAKRIVKDRMEFAEGKSYPILIHFSNLKSATKEAREYMSSPTGGLQGISKGAFLSSSTVTSVVVNFYLKINKPEVPAKFFTKKEEAVAWLKAKTQKQ